MYFFTDNSIPQTGSTVKKRALYTFLRTLLMKYFCFSDSSNAEGALPSPGEKVAERSEVGCGMRETQLDMAEGKDLLKPYLF